MTLSVTRVAGALMLVHLAVGAGYVVHAAWTTPSSTGLTPTTAELPPAPRPPAPPALARPVGPAPRLASSRADPAPGLESVDLTEVHEVLVPGRLPGRELFPVAPITTLERDDEDEPISATAAPLGDSTVLLRLSSEPAGAAILVDGRRRGRTPAKLRLAPGAHVIRLELNGRRTTVRESLESDASLCFASRRRSLERVGCASGGSVSDSPFEPRAAARR